MLKRILAATLGTARMEATWEGVMALERKADPQQVDDDVEVLMSDPDHKIIHLRVTREAMEDYYDSRGIKCASIQDMFLGPAYADIVEAADRIYAHHPRPKPSRILVTTKDLSG